MQGQAGKAGAANQDNPDVVSQERAAPGYKRRHQLRNSKRRVQGGVRAAPGWDECSTAAFEYLEFLAWRMGKLWGRNRKEPSMRHRYGGGRHWVGSGRACAAFRQTSQQPGIDLLPETKPRSIAFCSFGIMTSKHSIVGRGTAIISCFAGYGIGYCIRWHGLCCFGSEL